jgi:hypothetical protein
MSVRIVSSFLKSPAALSAEERAVRAVKITPLAGSAAARRSFHLAPLIDVSGSMDGVRLDAVKVALRLLIQALADGDVLTLISYESSARVVARATTIDSASRVTLTADVDALRADGGTNLEAALTALRDAAVGAPAIDAAFILTDGHINQGLTASVGLTRLLSAAVPAGTPVYTLGFGADHNSRMLRDMALRTRGSYTYADAAELIPATIADIISGLATEVGRRSHLVIPDGWKCLELTAEAGASEFNTGALVADKDQWIVLEAPPGPLVDIPGLTFVWHDATGASHIEFSTSYTDFDPLDVAEQHARCRVATVQARVQELLESANIADARTALTELGAELDASLARDRTFVISLRAQIDETLEALNAPVLPAFPAGLGQRAGWGPALRGGGAPFGAMPSLAPVMSRMASNTAALGAQRGFMSHINSTPMPSASGARAPSGITHTFSSPAQQRATHSMREEYVSRTSQVPTTEAEDTVTALVPTVEPPTTPPRLGRSS